MASYPISDGPHNDEWKSLLRYSFAVVDEVIREHNLSFPIQIGGGSMLLRRYGHRKSKDRDGRSVVIKIVDATGRARQISNPLGPAILSVDTGPRWFIDGVERSEDAWRRSAGEPSRGR